MTALTATATAAAATTFETIRAKTAALQEQIKALQAEAAEQIKPLLQQFITDNPQVAKVFWTQYTPYFNDGDTCEFRLNDIQFLFTGEEVDEDDEGHYSFGNAIRDGVRGYRYDHRGGKFEPGSWLPTLEVCSVETQAACEALQTELNGLEDALKTLFGDHVKVIVTADGVEVEEYDHD